jgi:lipopolysaccharide/colanic/teichoic acid biosynthesis glycosyltransferase
VLKRSLDVFIAGLLLVIALPLMVLAAVVIKLDSRGPVLFRQTRMGRSFVRFQLLKLRTMRVDLDGSVFTLGKDERITRVGGWLRRLKIDELPQLLNVLRGEMSLVGPRPVIPELTIEFDWAYRRLLQVRPGLTDPATIKYCRETEMLARVSEPLRYFKLVVTPDKLRISQAYMARATVLTDIEMLVRTAVALLPQMGPPEPVHGLSAAGQGYGVLLRFPESARRKALCMAPQGGGRGSNLIPIEVLLAAQDNSGQIAISGVNSAAYSCYGGESTFAS